MIYAHSLSDIEVKLRNAPDQSNRGYRHRGEPWTRRFACLVHKSLQAKVNEANNIGQQLHPEPRRFIYVVGSEYSHHADRHCVCSKCSRRKGRRRRRHCWIRRFASGGLTRVEALGIRQSVVALDGIADCSHSDL